MARQYKSEALASTHDTALGLTEAGVMPKRTMEIFDELCSTPVRDLSPAEIRTIRLREQASQAVFARYLNVTSGRVSQWERGTKRPRGASLKLLTLVAKKGLQTAARRPPLDPYDLWVQIANVLYKDRTPEVRDICRSPHISRSTLYRSLPLLDGEPTLPE